MLFSSYEFIFVFLPLMFIVYYFLISNRLLIGAKVWLVLGSLFFYGWWDVSYLPLIFLSIFVNYAIGTGLGSAFVNASTEGLKTRKQFGRKKMLSFGIIFNLSLLGYFKYTDFFIANFNYAFNSGLQLQNIALPLAISFFTFQQIAYLVDSYRGETREYDLLNYMLFVTFFPQLIAGPIVHHKHMMPQFSSSMNFVMRHKNISLGFFIFSIGLFKKVVIADYFSVWANHGFDDAAQLNFIEAWATSLSYTFQLYFDFSGYADMAIGSALLFNIKLPINFNSPYKSLSIQDFWRRWHITLSNFLRDYIYIPLGGNRSGNIGMYVNLLATFVIGGFWHGASWMFIVWGFMHGIALIVHRLWMRIGWSMWNWLAWLITFNFINVAWVFFRAHDLKDAIKVLGGMAGINGMALASFNVEIFNEVSSSAGVFLWISLAFIVVLFFKNSTDRMNESGLTTLTAVFSAILAFFGLIYLSMHETSDFIYFNF